jgi:hypothetical protein
MKRSATNRNLLIVLLLLVGASFGINHLQGSRYETGESAQAAESMFEWQAEDVAHLSIKGPKAQDVELSKEGEEWIVTSQGGYRADQSTIDTAVTSLVDLKKGRIISSQMDQLTTFDLEGEEAIRLQAKNAGGELIADVTLGKTSDDFRSFYLRIGEDETIRKVESPIRSNFDKSGPAGGWRDKTIFDGAVEEGEVDRLSIEQDGQLTMVFEREDIMGPKDPAAGEEGVGTSEGAEDGGAEEEMEVKESVWNMVVPEEGRAVKYQVSNMVRTLTDLKCDGFYDGDKSLADLGLEPPKYKITAAMGENTQVLLMGETDEDGKYPVRRTDQDVTWMLQGWRGNYFSKTPEDLLEKQEEEPVEEATDPAAPAAEDSGTESDAGGEQEHSHEGHDHAAEGETEAASGEGETEEAGSEGETEAAGSEGETEAAGSESDPDAAGAEEHTEGGEEGDG